MFVEGFSSSRCKNTLADVSFFSELVSSLALAVPVINLITIHTFANCKTSFGFI